MLVSNNPYELTHLAGAGTRERIDTGLLGIVAARVRGADVSKLVALELVGQAGRFPGLLSWSAREFEVRSGGPVEVGLDGEALVLDPPLRFAVAARGAARAAAPRRRPGTGGPRGGAHHGQPGRAGAGGRRPVRHPTARLVLGLVVFVLVGWAVGELWLSIVGSADLDEVRDIAAQRSAALTDVARVITWAGSAFVLVPLALICCLALGWAGLRREALVVALSLGGAILLSDLVKLLVSRSRPPVAHLQAVTGTSFPSGHATQASAFWFSLVLVLRAAGAPPLVTYVAGAFALILVLGVAASRVYLGVHYPGDVVAGVLLGTGWTAFVVCCVQKATVQ